MKKFIKYKDKYMVSDHGEVYEITKNGLRLKKQHISATGYMITAINHHPTKVHRIVMEAFKGTSDLVVDHINENKHDNRLVNLEYVTVKENNTRAKAVKVKWNGKEFRTMRELAIHLNVDYSAPHNCIKNNSKLKGYFIEKVAR